jgi:RsiW-degrading membrane proteinase PrsW (M82 family)
MRLIPGYAAGRDPVAMEMKLVRAGSGIRNQRWLVGLGAAAAYWAAAVLVLLVTKDSLVGGTVVMVGGAAVPVAMTVGLFERFAPTGLTPARVLYAFLAGGGVAFLMGASMDTWLVPSSASRYVAVGLIEELSKLIILVAVGVGLRGKTARTGIVLGGALGFGYAAFESTGYALDAYAQTLSSVPNFAAGSPLVSLIWVEVLRASVAPFTHGLWTAILGAVAFGWSGRWRLPAVGATYLLVSMLHASWDASDRTARQLTRVVWNANARAPEVLAEVHLAALHLPRIAVYYTISALLTVVLVTVGVLMLRTIERHEPRDTREAERTD